MYTARASLGRLRFATVGLGPVSTYCRGVHFLDCPVSGGPRGAAAGCGPWALEMCLNYKGYERNHLLFRVGNSSR